MSFFEFREEFFWPIFAGSLNETKPGQHLNQFVERDAINAWASHADLAVSSIRSGNSLHIPIPEEIVMEDGTRMGNFGTFGQSVAILERRP